MELTASYERVLPDEVLSRFEVRETRNAAAVLSGSDPELFEDLLAVLGDFSLSAADLLLAGGNEGTVAKKINRAFREHGWREARVVSTLSHTLITSPYRPAGEKIARREQTEPLEFGGYKADFVKRRVAGDCEWNAKDGNLDRNTSSYRALYDSGFIDVAVLITRTQDDLRELEATLIAELLASPDDVVADALGARVEDIEKVRARLLDPKTKGGSRLATSTTTNLPQLITRMKRGDLGGCPLLAIGISENSWDGSTATRPA
jgi:hypothetical protein